MFAWSRRTAKQLNNTSAAQTLRARRCENRRSRRRAPAARSRGTWDASSANAPRKTRRAAPGPGRTAACASRSVARLQPSGSKPGQGRSVLAVHSRTSPQRKPRRAGRVRGHLPFHLGRQAAAGPARPGIGLPPAQVHRALAAGHARRLAEQRLHAPRRWPTPICSTWRGPRRPSARPRAAARPSPAAARARGGRSRRRRRTPRTGAQFTGWASISNSGTSTSCAHFSTSNAKPPGVQPSSQRPAGTSSGSRGCAPARQRQLERHAQRLRHRHQLLAAQVLVEQRHAEEVQRRRRLRPSCPAAPACFPACPAGRPGRPAKSGSCSCQRAACGASAGLNQRSAMRLDRRQPHRVRRAGRAQAALRIAADPVFGQPGDVAGQPQRQLELGARAARAARRPQRLLVVRQQVQACGCARPSAPATAARGRRGRMSGSSIDAGTRVRA